MFKGLLSLIYSGTGKDTTIVFFGTLINVIVGGLFFVFAPRFLGPSDYGLFSTVIATALMVTSIANFGIDSGILRFAKTDPTVIPLAFKTYSVLGFAAALIGFFLAPYLANFLNYPQISVLLQIAFFGTVLLLLSNFFIASLQAKSQFLKASIVSVVSNAARLTLLLIGIIFFKINIYFLTALFFAVPVVSIVFGLIYLPINFEKSRNSKKFFKYNSWIASALILSSIPFDNYFLLKLAGPIETGLYFAPYKILTFVYQFAGNFTRVLSSRFSSFETNQKAIEFAKKSLIFPGFSVLGLLILILISGPVINLIFGPEFKDAVNTMRVLTIGFIFFFISTVPSSIILYYFGKSNISFIITAIKYLFFVVMLSILVPDLKAVGAALAFSFSELVSLILMSAYCLIKLQKR